MRDPRHRRPGLRNFSVLNVLWNGIQRLWLAVPQGQRAGLGQQGGWCWSALGRARAGCTWPTGCGCWAACCTSLQPSLAASLPLAPAHTGLGGCRVLEALLGFARHDVRACHRLLDPGMAKLLLYWAQKAGHLLASFPAAGQACWGALLEVPLGVHAELARLEAAADGVGPAAELAAALRHKVLPAASRLLTASLNAAAAAGAEAQLRVMLDALRMRLTAGGGEAGAAPPPALASALHLLRGARGLGALARHHCVALLGGVMDALPGPAFAAAACCGALRREVEEAAFVFLAACCHAAAAAPGCAGRR
jgi:hypothetical protein